MARNHQHASGLEFLKTAKNSHFRHIILVTTKLIALCEQA
ncbi:hypothetical protein AtDm6_0081 [Acetobacter tropicalis]|uniref:Uncharacterized protein n=1 Tax=Acetobacter tropicalis TaxID=104102 RepID=A0A094YZB3_9PROT|nr:hypothetical protein AtDm6_0081 [Acetobacter tropicalis]